MISEQNKLQERKKLGPSSLKMRDGTEIKMLGSSLVPGIKPWPHPSWVTAVSCICTTSPKRVVST